ncbi:MAG: serpin family protein [Acidimicrobiales bacterium]
MSSTPDQPRVYEPSNPAELLVRAKRRSSAIRRRRLAGTGGSLVVVLALVLGGLLIPGDSSPARTPYSAQSRVHLFVAERIGSSYELTAKAARAVAAPARVTRAVEKAEVGFSLALLKRLAGSHRPSNRLVSPSSLATALAMLELGAGGSTLQGIASTLQSAGLSAGVQAAGWHSLEALLASQTSAGSAALAKMPQLDVANALWIQQHFGVQPGFIRALASNFGTGVWQTNFSGDLAGAIAAINRWTSEHTHGLIKRLFTTPGAIDPSTVLVLADAVYLHARWAHEINGEPQYLRFHLPSGHSVGMNFMTSGNGGSSGTITVPSSVTRGYDAVELPYVGGKLSAVILMPTRSTLPRFVSSLTPGSLAKMVHGMHSASLELSMPSFTIRANNLLNGTLASMGMSSAFSSSANFSGINPRVGLQVQTVEQRAYLRVTPKGTVAAAVTGISMTLSKTTIRGVKTIVIDRPFLFLVRDNATGTILFESMVENPNAGS